MDFSKSIKRDFQSYVDLVDGGDDFSNDLFNFNRNRCFSGKRQVVCVTILSKVIMITIIVSVSLSHIFRSILFYERGLFSIIYTIIFALWFALYLFIFVRVRVQRHLRAILEYNKEFGFDHQFKQNQDLIKYSKLFMIFCFCNILFI